ncbi:sensor domain-containing phosphodiesterase [Nakamurella sp. GG22]
MTAIDGVLTLGVVLGGIGAIAALVWARRSVNRVRHAGGAGVPDWIWTVDLTGKILSSNDSCLDVLGYSADELVGRNAAIFMDPTELMRAEAMVRAAGVPEEGLGNLIISATHRDGSSSWFEVCIQPEVDASGAMVGCRGVSRHIGPDAAQVVASRAMRSRIQRIIDNRLLVIAFQPIVDVRTGAVLGVEALSRMTVEPSSRPDIWFAEAAAVGLGTDLELLAIDTALTAAVALPPELSVSLNASPETCLDQRLAAMIGSSSIDPRRLVLEVTEHSQVLDYEPLTAALYRFRQSGIRIAVDDAGAGFASGQHIVKIRPDVVKLDRSIISGIDVEPDQRALAAGFVAFAAHIGAVLTAEGIQTPEEATTVVALGIHCGQGFLYGAATGDARVWRTWNCLPLQSRHRTHPPSATEKRCPEPTFGTAALDALPDPTAGVDAAGVIIAVNQA